MIQKRQDFQSNKYDQFYSLINRTVSEFRNLDRSRTVRIISHLDSDGISACSILISALKREGIKSSVSIVRNLTDSKLQNFSEEIYDTFFFTDLGSGQLKQISKVIGNKKVFILDHHFGPKMQVKNVFHVNPHLAEIHANEISGAGVVYLFCERLNEENSDMIHLAIVGAIGDMQEKDGFVGLNDQILQRAIELGKVKVEKGLKLFGRFTKPLHKVLEYSTNPFIPGITGNESAALSFLKELGIKPKVGNTWKKLIHLNEKDIEKLGDAIIKKRIKEKEPKDIFGNIYSLPHEDRKSPMYDVREFSTVLNACGRMNKGSVGIGACLGDKNQKIKAVGQLKRYKGEILTSMNWYQKNKDKLIRGNGYVIINSKDKIRPTLIGTTCSIISKSGEYEDNTLVLAVGKNDDKTYKASMRICGFNVRKDLNAKDIVEKICIGIKGCRNGGHKDASGILIPTDKKNEFIRSAIDFLEKKGIEEFIEES